LKRKLIRGPVKITQDMARTESFEPITLSYEAAAEPAERWMDLNVVVAYQDLLTREWAREVCSRTTRRVGTGFFRSTWWKTDFLAHPQLFAKAIEAAIRADVMIVSVHAAETIPVVLSRWFEEWLAQRAQQERAKTGALIALIAARQPAAPQLASTRECLRGIADRGHLDFLPHDIQAFPDGP
jgi:hypothetical protein